MRQKTRLILRARLYRISKLPMRQKTRFNNSTRDFNNF